MSTKGTLGGTKPLAPLVLSDSFLQGPAGGANVLHLGGGAMLAGGLVDDVPLLAIQSLLVQFTIAGWGWCCSADEGGLDFVLHRSAGGGNDPYWEV